MKSFRNLLPVIAVALGLASLVPARAERVFGLETNNTLFTFDSATPGTTTTIGVLSGVLVGQSVVGMDFRPATNELVAMSYNTATQTGYLYTVNTSTAVLTVLGSGFVLPATATSANWAFDFNPVVDRIRAVNGNTHKNFRLSPLTGGLAGEDTDITPAESIYGLAYSNSVAGATSTTTFAYNYTNDTLGTIGGSNGIPSPNAGQYFSLGGSGVSTNSAALDIDISGITGVGYGVLSSTLHPSAFYTFSTTTGAFTLVGDFVGRTVADLAVDPVPPIVYYHVTVKANPFKWGKVTGGGDFAAGTKVTVKATPKTGRKFLGWYQNNKCISKKRILVIPQLKANRTLTARFS